MVNKYTNNYMVLGLSLALLGAGPCKQDGSAVPLEDAGSESDEAVEACESSVIASVTTGPGTGAQGFYDTRLFAVSFVLSASKVISKVALNLTRDSGATGTVSAHIESNSGGQPSGTVLGANPAGQVSVATLPGYLATSALNAEFVFGTPVSLSAGTYWLVLETSGVVGLEVYAGLVTPTTNASYKNGVAAWASFTNYTMRYGVSACN